ncbi:MAG: PmoA family protein [Cyclobacteriaceae bacterium]
MKLYFSFFVLVILFAAVKHWPTPDQEEQILVEKTLKPKVRLLHHEEERKVDVMIGDQLFTSYIFPQNLEKPLLYPVYAPGQVKVTRGFPLEPRPAERVDHPHHVGIWFNYGDVNGLDFWNNSYQIPEDRKQHYGSIEHKEVVKMSDGDQAVLQTHAIWLAPDGSKLLDEYTTFTFSQQGNVRMIDRSSRLKAASQEVRFDDNKEGMLAVRVTRELEMPSESPVLLTDASGKPASEKVINNENVNGDYLSSEGITGAQVWGTRARWMKLHGKVEDKQVAIAIIDHPENPGYPTYWHARSYGLFAANPLGQKVFSDGKEEMMLKLSPGEEAEFSYRILISGGEELEEKKINALADTFAKNKDL